MWAALSPPETVWVSILTQGIGAGLQAATILQNVPVIGVDQDASAEQPRATVERTVKVEVTPQTVQQSFDAALSNMSSAKALDGKVAAQSSAGHAVVACGVAPLMFCIPDADYRSRPDRRMPRLF